MERTTSTDGTEIAYHRHGEGPVVVIVVGAMSTAAAARPLAEALAAAGRQAVRYDRRGRGDSGDTAPYAPEREVEDLRSVIEAVGGSAAVLGHSAGAVLALMAAGAGVPMAHLFVSEPPLRFGQDEPPADLAERLQALVDDGREADAVVTFQRENVRLTEEQLGRLVADAAFADQVALAQTAVYDTLLIGAVSTPTPAMLAPAVQVTILRGEPAAPVLITAGRRLAELMPAELVVVPESRDHALDPDGTTREVVART